MSGFSVSDYGIFADAMQTTNNVKTGISQAQTELTEVKRDLNDEFVFNGPGAESCVSALDNINNLSSAMSNNFEQIFKYIGDVSVAYKAGDVDAKNVVLNASNSNSTNTPSANSNGGTTLTGSSNSEKVWNYLRDKGFSKAGTAGIMGNLQQESGLNAANVQNNMGYSDADYVAAIKSGKITREEFINDKRGFGIAQWTYPSRKAALYDTLGAQNIDSLSGQLDFMVNEMGSNLTANMKNASDVTSATDTFQYSYERAGTPNMTARRNNASNFYDKYNY